MKDLVVLQINESSQVAEARRLAATLAGRLGFNETETGKVSIVVTEAATNLIKHAGGGKLLLRSLSYEGGFCMEVLTLDKGPGMLDIGRCLDDGYSTTGSSGTGLGAISRLSVLFDIYSLQGSGTALLARLCPDKKSLKTSFFEFGAVCVPKPGEEVCGDAWATQKRQDGVMILVADGLGHGPDAAMASMEAVRVFDENPLLPPAGMLEVIHEALKKTRGAAVAVMEVDLARQEVKFSGVGNIAATVLSDEKPLRMVSHNGTVGHQIYKIKEFSYRWPERAVLILHSDGLTTRWNLDNYPGLIGHHSSLIAGLLYRDFSRGNDDITVLVAKQNRITR